MDEMKTQLGGYNTYNIFDDCKLRNDNVAENLNGYACGSETVLPSYLNLKEVRSALHVQTLKDMPVWPGNHGYRHYNKSCSNTVQYFPKFIKNGLRVLIYSGDVDSCIPYIGTEQWVRALGYKITQPWRPWTIDGGSRMGGYTILYESGITFATVRGAGHEVPRCEYLLFSICSKG